jgi:hypothetical protein
MDYTERREALRQRKVNEEAAARRLALTRMKRSYVLNETMAEESYPDIWRHIANNENVIRVNFRVPIFPNFEI